MIEPMKKILLTLSLLCGLMATVSAQGLYQLYGSFDNEQHLDKTADYLTLPQGMNIAVLYTNTPLINRPQNAELLTQTGLLPETMVGTLTQSHGYSITSDYIQPIWGPFGITFNWMDMTMTFGKWDTNKLKTGVPSEATGDAMMFSWGIGIMPTFGVNFGNASLRIYGGIKGYLTFFDGPNEYPLNSSNEKNRSSIGSFAFANFIAGADLLVTKHFGFRFTYQWGWTQRMKKAFYEGGASEKSQAIKDTYNPNGWTKDMYNPRYDFLSAGILINFDF